MPVDRSGGGHVEKRPRWRLVKLTDRHLRSHGKIVDYEQS